MHDNRSIWVRALRSMENEHQLAPWSFSQSSLASIVDLVAICTRSLRLQLSIRHSRSPITASKELTLGCPLPPSVEKPSESPQSQNESQSPASANAADLELLAAYLCPGGRWIVGAASDRARKQIGVYCWDVRALQPAQKVLLPAASGLCPNTSPWSSGFELYCTSGAPRSHSVLASVLYDGLNDST